MIAPNDSELVRQASLPALQEETSRSATLGFTWTPTDNLSLTMDAHRIDIDDCAVLGGDFSADDPDNPIAAILRDRQAGVARFFANAVNTRTQGVDPALSHTGDVGGASSTPILAPAITRLKWITSICRRR